ncbi:hypothetical protein QN362_18360 [Actimicrobium sp. CCC2.4]|uniref:hypothetical protein n=1 Tax=Actimicrobium sp. CCC2.4 TaxID=3048606 RepID=UPI002AC98EEE|nr:hypothetical protein [Actimicrobium sp. CCC2.4]MEB0137299.1 hypothetical protein [Actimicrobium sp. CCC2.4]WPX32519.1 hypothetical protein RHM62_01325 [Actimicrobium sp. CCC2.4]
MNINAIVRPAVLLALLAVSLAGCSKNTVPELLEKKSSESVALPVSEIPPQPAGMAPQPANPTPPLAADSGNANGPSQANPRMLSAAQESATMPLPGQAGDHSTPAPISSK